MKFWFRILVACLVCFGGYYSSSAQPTLSFELKKPKKFENKKLGSEKSAEKKFTRPRRFIQNTVTHYNWYFNANNRLEQVLERAKTAYRDDYSRLLSFYSYDPDQIAQDKSELDSVLYKANAGILIHDLRNDWIDNLYMLMGQAYYFKKEFDSAYLTFQYINYAFAPKEKDGYDIPIGSNSTEGGSAFSISTKEKDNIVKRVFSTPPSRNESLLWQIRTYISKDEMAEAAGLIETLRLDPAFPDRLASELNEVRALWFYQKEIYDSAAVYLEKALEVAENRQAEARWEYLIAQLYERANNPQQAQEFYARAIRHTLDPVMEVYARLNFIRQNKEETAIQQNIDDLVKMARKDRYSAYRDIIYYTAAQIELERNNIDGARNFLLLSTQADLQGNVNAGQKAKAFLMLGDLSFANFDYANAKRFYDSVNVEEAGIKDVQAFDIRKNALNQIVYHAAVVTRQDSLQRIAQMSEEEREAFVKKLVKKYRKEQGLKEEESITSVADISSAAAIDLFNAPAKGEWYFNNSALKTRGFNEFKKRWGNRPNVDNWRRIGAVNQYNANIQQTRGDVVTKPGVDGTIDFSYEGMMKNLPLTAQQLATSNDSIEQSTMMLGKMYLEGLEDYKLAIRELEGLVSRFPYSNHRPEALFLLHYAYKKSGDQTKADAMLKELQEKYPGSRHEISVTSSVSPQSESPQQVMTRHYEAIYNLFIEGRFEEALQKKKIADSLFESNYWTPQLLYIQSIYHIRQKEDAEAKKVLQQITNLFPSSPLSAKAKTMLDVLGRRREIEDYLTKLDIQRPTEVASVPIDTITSIQREQPPPVVRQPVTVTTPRDQVKVPSVKTDTVQSLKAPVSVASAYIYNPGMPHYVALVTDKVDPVYVTESRNAFNRFNKEKYYNRVIDISTENLDESTRLVLMGMFETSDVALEYLERVRKVAATEIIPWMPQGKYSFVVISGQNIEVLKNLKSLTEYKKFLGQHYPGKF